MFKIMVEYYVLSWLRGVADPNEWAASTGFYPEHTTSRITAAATLAIKAIPELIERRYRKDLLIALARKGVKKLRRRTYVRGVGGATVGTRDEPHFVEDACDCDDSAARDCRRKRGSGLKNKH